MEYIYEYIHINQINTTRRLYILYFVKQTNKLARDQCLHVLVVVAKESVLCIRLE